MMAYNEDMDPTLPQDISNVFSAADLLSHLSSNATKYNCACIKAKVIRSSILSSGESPDACSRELSMELNHKEIASIMAMTGAIFPKRYANAITRHEQKKKIVPCNICP